MSEEAEEDLGEIVFESPEPVIVPAGDGVVIIPCIHTLGEALGGDVIAYSTDASGKFYFMTSAREWSPVETPKRDKLKAVEKPN